MPFFDFEKTKIHYIDTGNGTLSGLPLVFVHGAGSSHFCWTFQLVEFSQTNRCIAIDLSGHGKSDRMKEDASIDRGFAYEVAALINHLKIQEFILVGHSMGGGVAMSYVLNDEFKSPKALVLVDSSPDLNLAKVVPGLIVEVIEERSQPSDHCFEDYAEKHNLKQYQKVMKQLDTIAMQRDLLACNKFNISDRVKDITVPTFALVGEDDDVITPTIVHEYIERIPRADLAVVRKADHVPMIDQPEEFNRLFRKFIDWVQK